MTAPPWTFAGMFERIEALEVENERWEAVCTCDLAGPDSFGNFDLIENDACPVHGSAAHA